MRMLPPPAQPAQVPVAAPVPAAPPAMQPQPVPAASPPPPNPGLPTTDNFRSQ
jgi:hypothetical protein